MDFLPISQIYTLEMKVPQYARGSQLNLIRRLDAVRKPLMIFDRRAEFLSGVN